MSYISHYVTIKIQNLFKKFLFLLNRKHPLLNLWLQSKNVLKHPHKNQRMAFTKLFRLEKRSTSLWIFKEIGNIRLKNPKKSTIICLFGVCQKIVGDSFLVWKSSGNLFILPIKRFSHSYPNHTSKRVCGIPSLFFV